MLKVFYYYYYLFYTRIIPDSAPHATTVFVLSFTQSLFLIFITEFLWVHTYCEFLLEKWSMVTILLVLLGSNYLLFSRSDWGRKIVSMKPLFFNSKVLSIVTVAITTMVIVSFLFWMTDYLLGVIENCSIN